MTSLPFLPTRTSSPGVPTIVACLPAQVAAWALAAKTSRTAAEQAAAVAASLPNRTLAKDISPPIDRDPLGAAHGRTDVQNKDRIVAAPYTKTRKFLKPLLN